MKIEALVTLSLLLLPLCASAVRQTPRKGPKGLSRRTSRITGLSNMRSLQSRDKEDTDSTDEVAGNSSIIRKTKESSTYLDETTKVPKTPPFPATEGKGSLYAGRPKVKGASDHNEDIPELPKPKEGSKGRRGGDEITGVYHDDDTYESEGTEMPLKGMKKKTNPASSKSKLQKSAKKSSSAPSSTPNTEPIGPPSRPPYGSLILQLTAYGLEYTVTEERVPFRSEFLEVVEVTRAYLNGFFKDEYDDMEVIDLEELHTVFVGSSFDFGRPILIDYESSVVIRESSLMIPTQTELDRTLSSALRGENLNGFIGMLQALPPQNIFSTTIFVNQTKPGQGVSISFDSTGRTKESTNAKFATTTITGTAALFMALATAVLVRRRRTLQENDRELGKDFGGEDTVATSTSSRASWLLPSEENVNLGKYR